MYRRSFLNRMALGLLVPATASAQVAAYPSQPIRWVLGYSAGGGIDVVVRTVAGAMQSVLGQNIIVDNRPGASTNIAAELVAKARPDGYTILSVDNAATAFNEHLFSRLPYDPAKDFTYLGGISTMPLVLVTHPSFPAHTIGEFLTYVKANPGRVDYASPGNGSPHHLAMEMFKRQTGLFITHIPYRGSVPALSDLMGGQVPCMMLDMGTGLPAMQAQKVRALAIASPKRSPLLPDVPTFAEAGIRDSEVSAYHGLVAPAGMLAPIREKLSASLVAALDAPAVQQRFKAIGADFLKLGPDEFRAMVRGEAQRWGPIIKSTGIKLD